KLTSYSDREQLDALIKYDSTDALRAWPLILVRHGKAFPRSKWHETEHVRPLLKLGTRQAMALTGLLSAWETKKLISSPWKRCMATLAPLSAATGRSIKKVPTLSEKATSANPAKTARFIEKLLTRGRPVIYCTHRPVLPTIFSIYAAHAPKRVVAKLPKDDPYLKPGEVLIAYVRPGPLPRIVEIERVRPIVSCDRPGTQGTAQWATKRMEPSRVPFAASISSSRRCVSESAVNSPSETIPCCSRYGSSAVSEFAHPKLGA